jgi:hypothetical protein
MLSHLVKYMDNFNLNDIKSKPINFHDLVMFADMYNFMRKMSGLPGIRYSDNELDQSSDEDEDDDYGLKCNYQTEDVMI